MGHIGEDVLLGVGLSGNGHWSIAVHPTNSEPSQDQHGLYRGLAFDTACKTSKDAARLGSLWRIAPLWTTPEDELLNCKQIVLTNHSTGKAVSVHLSVIHGRAMIHRSPTDITLEVAPDSDLCVPQTHRWAIRIETVQERSANEPFA